MANRKNTKAVGTEMEIAKAGTLEHTMEVIPGLMEE